jgi:hypothetical protein
MATSRVEKALSQASPLVFISSTFRDMHEERAELVKRVFRVEEFQRYCATVPTAEDLAHRLRP